MTSWKVWGPKTSVGLHTAAMGSACGQPAGSELQASHAPPSTCYQITVKPPILLPPREMPTVVVYEAVSEFPSIVPFQGSRAGLCVTLRKPLASDQLEEGWGVAGGPLILDTGGDREPGPWPGCVCPMSIINTASSLETEGCLKFRAVCQGVTPLAYISCAIPVPLSTSHLDPAQGSPRRGDAGSCLH